MSNFKKIYKAVQELSKDKQADIYLLNGAMSTHVADDFVNLILNKKKQGINKNCVLYLTTYGGQAEAAYRIAKIIDRCYDKLHLLVSSYCKSAGTLLALRSNSISMGNFAEFGPLDVQLVKDDELKRTSGLSYFQSINSIVDLSFEAFEENFLKLKHRSGFSITSKLAAEISTKLAIGMFSPISSQLEPLKLGEVKRSIDIAEKYGKRLVKNGCGNEEIVDKLINNYPVHGFVIDIDEAKELFENVDELNANEIIIVESMFKTMRYQEESGHLIVDLIQSMESINKRNAPKNTNKKTIAKNGKRNNSRTTKPRAKTNIKRKPRRLNK